MIQKKEEAKKEEAKKADAKKEEAKKEEAKKADAKKEEAKKEETKKEAPKKEDDKKNEGKKDEAKKEDAPKEGEKKGDDASGDGDESNDPHKPMKSVSATLSTVSNPKVVKSKDGVSVNFDVDTTVTKISAPDEPQYEMINNMASALSKHVPHAVVANNYGPNQQVFKDAMTVHKEEEQRRIEDKKEEKLREEAKKKA